MCFEVVSCVKKTDDKALCLTKRERQREERKKEKWKETRGD